MNSAREVYERWAPQESIWSPWVTSTVFHALRAREVSAAPALPSVAWRAGERRAVVVDLPRELAILTALAIADREGLRPVPVINACASPLESVPGAAPIPVAVPLEGISDALCWGAGVLPQVPAEAAPVFALDSERLKSAVPLEEDTFDNRWTVFPQDFPSARFLKEHGIEGVLLVQAEGDQPQEDLAHVLLRWQEAGLPVSIRTLVSAEERPAQIRKPSGYRAFWHRWLAMAGLTPNSAGGFGDFIPGSGG